MTRRATILTGLLILSLVTIADSQLVPDPFRYDVAKFFAGAHGKTWVGQAHMFNLHYTDTVHVRYDGEEGHVFIRRMLVEDESNKLVSYGVGLIAVGAHDSVYSVSWTERDYPEATGTMSWDPEYKQWTINFSGEWKQWSINIRRIADDAFEAGVARQVASFPPVELLDATYHELDE